MFLAKQNVFKVKHTTHAFRGKGGQCGKKECGGDEVQGGQEPCRTLQELCLLPKVICLTTGRFLVKQMKQSHLCLNGAFSEDILKRSEVGEGRTDRYLLQLSREEKMMSQTRLRIQ